LDIYILAPTRKAKYVVIIIIVVAVRWIGLCCFNIIP
jgi:hypothetical protein